MHIRNNSDGHLDGFHYGFFLIKKYSCGKKISINHLKFLRFLLKPYILHTFLIWYRFLFIICTSPCMFHNFYLSALWSLLVNPVSNISQIQQWNKKRCGIFSNWAIKTNVPKLMRLLWCFFLLTFSSLHTLF